MAIVMIHQSALLVSAQRSSLQHRGDRLLASAMAPRLWRCSLELSCGKQRYSRAQTTVLQGCRVARSSSCRSYKRTRCGVRSIVARVLAIASHSRGHALSRSLVQAAEQYITRDLAPRAARCSPQGSSAALGLIARSSLATRLPSLAASPALDHLIQLALEYALCSLRQMGGERLKQPAHEISLKYPQSHGRRCS